MPCYFVYVYGLRRDKILFILLGDKFTILIVTDYKNTKYICDTIQKYSKKSCIIYDLVYCIGYELEAMSF